MPYVRLKYACDVNSKIALGTNFKTAFTASVLLFCPFFFKGECSKKKSIAA